MLLSALRPIEVGTDLQPERLGFEELETHGSIANRAEQVHQPLPLKIQEGVDRPQVTPSHILNDPASTIDLFAMEPQKIHHVRGNFRLAQSYVLCVPAGHDAGEEPS